MDSTTMTPKNDENAVDPNQTKIEKMKSLLEKVDWNNKKERYELFDQLCSLIKNWTGQYPNLRDIFPGPQEIENVLCDSVKKYESNRAKVAEFIDFVNSTDYKDVPDVDADGKPVLHRTTSVHFAAGLTKFTDSSLVMSLFKIYDGCQANYIGETGYTHFHIACKFNCLDVVGKFLQLGRVDPNRCLTQRASSLMYGLRCTDAGETPLHVALVSHHCSEELVELLLRHEADPNQTDPATGTTLLHELCWKCCSKEIGWLFKLSSDKMRIDARDKWGRTPLHIALFQPNKELIEVLLRNGANPNAADEKGRTSLHMICDKEEDDDWAESFFEIINRVNRVVQMDAVDEKGRTPLQLAVAKLLPYTVQALLENGADRSKFVFLDESRLDRTAFSESMPEKSKFTIVASALSIVNSLETEEYELDGSGALAIIKLFAKHGVFDESANLVDFMRRNEHWYDEDVFETIRLRGDEPTSPSLHDLLQLSSKSDKFSYADCFEFARKDGLGRIQPRVRREACELRLCKMLSRRYFRRWAMRSLQELTSYRLPVNCCDMILDRHTHQDYENVCFAAEAVRREKNKKEVPTNETECGGEKVPETDEKATKKQKTEG